MFENYPKKRIELPDKIRDIYDSHYKSNREGATTASNLASKLEQWMHKKVASDVPQKHNKRTLEIGAGTLNQLLYEEPLHYDIVEPYYQFYEDSVFLSKVNTIYTDIDNIDMTSKYDRIISVATFEHVLDLPKVIAKSCLLLNNRGTLRTSIPNEGTFLWTLGWKLTTGIEFRIKYGLNYGDLMRYEHVNSAKEIEEVLSYFYNVNECSVFG